MKTEIPSHKDWTLSNTCDLWGHYKCLIQSVLGLQVPSAKHVYSFTILFKKEKWFKEIKVTHREKNKVYKNISHKKQNKTKFNGFTDQHKPIVISPN